MFWTNSNGQTDCWLSKWLPKNNFLLMHNWGRSESSMPVSFSLVNYFSWGVAGRPRPLRWSSIVIGHNCDHGLDWLRKQNRRWLCQGGRCLIGMWDQTWLRFATGRVLLRLEFKLHFVFHQHYDRKSQYYVGRVWFVKIQRWVRLKWWSWGLVQAVVEQSLFTRF